MIDEQSWANVLEFAGSSIFRRIGAQLGEYIHNYQLHGFLRGFVEAAACTQITKRRRSAITNKKSPLFSQLLLNEVYRRLELEQGLKCDRVLLVIEA